MTNSTSTLNRFCDTLALKAFLAVAVGCECAVSLTRIGQQAHRSILTWADTAVTRAAWLVMPSNCLNPDYDWTSHKPYSLHKNSPANKWVAVDQSKNDEHRSF